VNRNIKSGNTTVLPPIPQQNAYNHETCWKKTTEVPTTKKDIQKNERHTNLKLDQPNDMQPTPPTPVHG
jgi:hypothetical protein